MIIKICIYIYTYLKPTSILHTHMHTGNETAPPMHAVRSLANSVVWITPAFPWKNKPKIAGTKEKLENLATGKPFT